VAGYIERSTVVGVTFTLLIFALTMQNFFIFRGLLNRLGLNDASATANLASFSYPQINYINFGNDLQSGFSLPSASFLDAVGASLAIYAGYTAVIGRISLGEVFFLSWIGTFIYELNSQILWRLFIPDNGYPSRAFAYGGTLGLVSSFILGQREKTKNNANYKSNYKTMAIAFLGIIFVWCSFPVLVLSNVYTSTTGKVVATAGQVNIWLALASGVLGCFAASSLQYRKFSIHDLIFASITVPISIRRAQLHSVPQRTSATTLEQPLQLAS
jgi:ammonia channel protein AmtB